MQLLAWINAWQREKFLTTNLAFDEENSLEIKWNQRVKNNYEQ